MLKTLRISFALKNTYRVNAILHSLKQIPLLRRLLPAALYQARGPKVFAGILAVLWEIATIFLFKFLYFFTMVCGVGILYRQTPSAETFLHILLFLTAVGSYLNSSIFDPTRDKYYAMILLRMDARAYTLANYGYAMVKFVVGFLPWTLFFGLNRGVPLGLCLAIPFSVAGIKLTMAADSLRDYEKHGRVRTESRLRKLAWLLTLVLLVLAYGPPALGFVLPLWASAVLWLIWIPLGLLSLRRICAFRYYREINQELLAQMFQQMDTAKMAVKTVNEKAISADTAITSRKSGFAFLNELFIKRHRKILWKSALRITAVCGILCCGVLAVLFLMPETRPGANRLVLGRLPYFTFILYMINRGTNFTSALFTNCDHSLLTYAFCKQPGQVVKLFRIRLWEIIKINAVPALVLGVGLDLILWASGGTDQPLHYGILPVTLLALSGFFSIHYLTAYYLLQPYTAGTEMKSGTYRLVMILTYVVCYAVMNLELPILVFGAAALAFCAIYSAVATVLVYRLAPRTFRIRT